MNSNIISQVLVLFFLIFLGFGSAKIKIFNSEAAGYFSVLILNITLPCMILYSFQRSFSSELLGEAGTALGVSAIIYILAFAVAIPYPYLLRIKGPERGLHRYGAIFSNVGFMGYPMVEAILGPDYLFHLSVFNIPFNLLAFSIGAWYIAKEGNKSVAISWKTFINPCVICTLLGFTLFFLSLPLPGFLSKSIKIAGDITSPLSMIVIGISLSSVNIRRMLGRWRIFVTILMRLLIMPALMGLVFYIIGIRGPLMLLAIIVTAMPIGTTTSILAASYNVAPEEGSALVFLSTLFSIVTIPLVVFFISQFN
jgi:predicted permease